MKELKRKHRVLAAMVCLASIFPLTSFSQPSGQIVHPVATLPDISSKIVDGAMKTGGLPPAVGSNDSVLVISGKIDTGTQNYHRVIAATSSRAAIGIGGQGTYFNMLGGKWGPYEEGGMYGSVPKGCKTQEVYKPQYKKDEAAGYKTFIIFKDTATK